MDLTNRKHEQLVRDINEAQSRKELGTEPLTNKEQLLLKAIDLFADKGFRGTTIREVSRATDVNAPTLYYHFGSKEGLWLAILEYLAKELIEELHKVSNMEMENLARFKLLLETHVRMSQKNRKRANIFFIDEEYLTPEGLKFIKRIHREILDLYVKELNNLEAIGYITGRNIKALAFNTLALINWQVRWYKLEGTMSLEDLIQEIITFTLNGILSRKD